MKINGTTELSKAVAEKVRGETFPTKCHHCKSENLKTAPHTHPKIYCADCGRTQAYIEPYATDANAALRMLYSRHHWEAYQGEIGSYVRVINKDRSRYTSVDGETFEIDACIAALRSVGVEVEYKEI